MREWIIRQFWFDGSKPSNMIDIQWLFRAAWLGPLFALGAMARLPKRGATHDV